MPSIVQSLVLIFSRLIVKHTEQILNFLINFEVEYRSGLKVLIDKWLLHQPLFRGKLFRNVSIKALIAMFNLKNKIIEELRVIPYDPSHTNATQEVSASLKILSTLIRCLHNEINSEIHKTMKNNYENLNLEQDEFEDNEEEEKEEKDEKEEEETAQNGKLNVGLDDLKDEEEEEIKEVNPKYQFLVLK